MVNSYIYKSKGIFTSIFIILLMASFSIRTFANFNSLHDWSCKDNLIGGHKADDLDDDDDDDDFSRNLKKCEKIKNKIIQLNFKKSKCDTSSNLVVHDDDDDDDDDDDQKCNKIDKKIDKLYNKLQSKCGITNEKLYVANYGDSTISVIQNPISASPNVTTLTDPSFNGPNDITFDPSSNNDIAYVVNYDGSTITKIAGLTTGSVSYSILSHFSFNYPSIFEFDPSSNGDIAYVANSFSTTITKISGLKSGAVTYTTLSHFSLVYPCQFVFDPTSAGDIMYVAKDCYNNSTDIVKISGLKSGPIDYSLLSDPILNTNSSHWITMDPASEGDALYVVNTNDNNNTTFLKISGLKTGSVIYTTLPDPNVASPFRLEFDPSSGGNIAYFVDDTDTNLTKVSGLVTGPITYTKLNDPSFKSPKGMVFDPLSNGNIAFVTNGNNNNTVVKVSGLKTGVITYSVISVGNYPYALTFPGEQASPKAP